MTVRMVASTPPREVEEPAAPPSTPTPQSPFIPDVTTRRVHPCAYCGIDGATHKCIKCKSGPRSAGAARDPARYCDDLCKDAHLPAHEADCKLYQTAKEVRALRRAGELLSDLFCIWREGCCDRPIVKVEQINERIFVYEDWEERMRTYPGGRLFPLSEDLFPNAEVKRAVLCNMSCDLSLAVLSDLFGFLLQGITPKNPAAEVQLTTFRHFRHHRRGRGDCQVSHSPNLHPRLRSWPLRPPRTPSPPESQAQLRKHMVRRHHQRPIRLERSRPSLDHLCRGAVRESSVDPQPRRVRQ